MELCSLDVQKSSNKAMICTEHLAKILHKGWQTKKKVIFKYFQLDCYFLLMQVQWQMVSALRN